MMRWLSLCDVSVLTTVVHRLLLTNQRQGNCMYSTYLETRILLLNFETQPRVSLKRTN